MRLITSPAILGLGLTMSNCCRWFCVLK